MARPVVRLRLGKGLRVESCADGWEHAVAREGEARAHAVSTVTIGSQLEPSACGARKNSHDVVPVIRFGGSAVGLLSMATGLVTEHLADGLISPTALPFLAVGTSS